MLQLRADTDADVIVIGGGHNGLVTAAYLARGGLRTLVLEAREQVGGTAASDTFAGATVNICNCDHITFRTTPVIDELELTAHGLEYLDLDPSQHNLAWAGGPAWTHHHDLEATLDSLRATFPDEVDGYRRYVEAARPAIELIFAAASEPPDPVALTRRALARRLAGVPTLPRSPGRWCGASAPRPPGAGSARSPMRCATSAGSVDRSAGAAGCRRRCAAPSMPTAARCGPRPR
jgi:beta-carotene ketolase (CrtO type)